MIDPQSRRTTQGRSRSSALILLLIIALAAGLRFYHLDHSSLWSDEGNTWALMARSPAQIARDAAADIHPPGYYWLLKAWTGQVGTQAAGLRSLSAVLGVLLVWQIAEIARRLARHLALPSGAEPRPSVAGIALIGLAGLLAALSPLQIYYSQEARMYMLLTVAGAGLFLALLDVIGQEEGPAALSHKWPWPLLRYGFWGALGLWTHYTFPALLGAAILSYLLWQLVSRGTATGRSACCHLSFALANILICLTFLPWLPTALEQVFGWPAGGRPVSLGTGTLLVLETLMQGPIGSGGLLRSGSVATGPWLAGAAILPVVGFLRHHRRPVTWMLALWLLAPLLPMFLFRLFGDAFLKFLLSGSPAWILLSALAVVADGDGRAARATTRAGFGVLAVGALAWAGLTLPAYYQSPLSRDNYAGVARYVKAVEENQQALVLLNAPGQQEVWRYYQEALTLQTPTLALPRQRPPDPDETLEALTEAVRQRDRVYALFWAQEQADPQGLVEHWLDTHGFKGWESWQGNVRLAVYHFPQNLACRSPEPGVRFGSVLQLRYLCQGPAGVRVGDGVIVGLEWQALAPMTRDYKVTLQLLNERDQVVAQHDGEPAGGSRPTGSWQPGEVIQDNHGVLVPWGTPPGPYRLILAVYDAHSGERLPVDGKDAWEIGSVQIRRPVTGIPVELIPMQHRRAHAFAQGPVLLGYDLYPRGYGHDPQHPVAPGEPVHVTLYWQAPPATEGWPPDMTFSLTLGGQGLIAPLAGGAFPTALWQPGDVVRGEFDLIYDGSATRPQLSLAGETLFLAGIPQ